MRNRHGTIGSLWIYPLYGGQAVNSSLREVTPLGLQGDRDWAVVDSRGSIVHPEDEPRLPHVKVLTTAEGGLEMIFRGKETLEILPRFNGLREIKTGNNRIEVPDLHQADAASEWLSDALGKKRYLVRLTDPAKEELNRERPPIMIVNGETVRRACLVFAFNGTPRYIRPNIMVEGLPMAEDSTWGFIAFRTPDTDDQSVLLRITRPAEIPVENISEPQPFGHWAVPSSREGRYRGSVLAEGQWAEILIRQEPSAAFNRMVERIAPAEERAAPDFPTRVPRLSRFIMQAGRSPAPRA